MEIIGGVGIEIVGDYSGLQSDLDAAQSLAASAATKIADALDIATPDTAPVTQALQQISDAATSTGQSIVTALDVQVAAPDVSAVVDSFAALSQAATDSASAITDGFSGVGSAIGAQVAPVDDFYAALSKLTDAGSSIDQAFQQLTGDTQSFMDAIASGSLNEFIDNFGKVGSEAEAASSGLGAVGSAASDAARQLKLFDEAIEVPYADAAGQLSMFATELEPIASAASTSAAATAAMAEEFAAAGEAAAAAAGGEKQYSDAAQAIVDTQSRLDSELAAAAGALAEIYSAYAAGATSAETLARAQRELADAAQAAAPAIKDTGDAAHDASSGFADLATQILALGGISLTIEALVDLGKAAVEASDKLDDAAYAIGRLNQGAMSGKEEIAGLLAVAQDEGLSFPGLVTAAQHMETLGIHGQDVIDTLRELGNASELTGGSIDSMAQKFATLSEGTSVSAMSLKKIGLTVDEVKDAMIDMGANADQVSAHWQQLWKVMDETQHADVLRGALENLDGAAKAMNDDIKGDVQRTMNEFYVAIGKLGDVIAPLAQQALPYLVDALKVLVVAADASITSFKVLLDVLVGYAGALKDVYSGLAEAGSAIARADFSGAATAVTSAIDRIKTDMSDMSTKIQSDVKAGADFAKQAWGVDVPTALGKTTAAAKDTSSELSNLALKSKDAGAEAKAYGAILQEVNDLLAKMPATYEDYFTALQNGGEKASALYKDVEKAIDDVIKKSAGLSGEAAANASALISKLEALKAPLVAFADADEWKKISDAVAGLDAKFDGIKSSTLDLFNNVLSQLREIPGAVATNGGALITWLKEAATQDAALEKQQQSTQATFDKAWLKYEEATQTQVIPITVTLGERLSDLDQKFKDINGVTFTQLAADLRGLGVTFDGLTDKENEAKNALIDIATSNTTTLPQIEQAWEKVGGVIEKLSKTDLPAAEDAWQAVLDKMIAANAPIGDILAIQAKMAQAYVDAAQKAGESANTSVIALDLIKQHVQDLHDSFANLGGNLFTAVLQTWNDAFKSLDNHLTDAITGAKSWHDAFQGFLQDMEKEITSVFIGVVLKGLRSEIDSLLGSLLGSVIPALNATTGGIGGLAGAATGATGSVKAVGEAASDAFPSISKAGTSASGLASGAGAAVSSLTGMVTAISSVIGALAGIAGDILQAHANNLLGEIEINTRSAFNEISNLRQDQWSQYGGLFQRLGDVWGTLQAMGASGTGQSEGMRNELDALSAIGQTLLDIDTNVYNVLAALQGGIGTSNKSASTADLSGQSLTALNAAVTALDGIWTDENLVVQGIQNLAVDIQALGNQSAQGASDFKNLFTNAQTTTAGQITTITKQISDNNAQIALAVASNNKALADSLTNQNAALQSQLDALNALKTNGSTTATNTGTTSTNTNTTAQNTAGLKEKLEASAEAVRQASETQVQAIGRGLDNLLSPLNAIVSNTGDAAQATRDLNGAMQNLGGELANLAESAGRAAANGTGQGNPGETTTSTPSDSGRAPAPGIPSPPKKSFDTGGYVDQDMIAEVHGGENVLTKDLSGDLAGFLASQQSLSSVAVAQQLAAAVAAKAVAAQAPLTAAQVQAANQAALAAAAAQGQAAQAASKATQAIKDAATIQSQLTIEQNKALIDQNAANAGVIPQAMADASAQQVAQRVEELASAKARADQLKAIATQLQGIADAAKASQVAAGVMAKSDIEMSATLNSIANGPMNKTPVQDPGGDPVKIVGITAEAAAFFGGTSGSAQQQQQGPSQQDLLAASMAWLDAQQGITADQKAISAATYQADAEAGLLPSPGGSGSSFSGYNPYSTPTGPQAAPLSSSTPSGPANKTPLIDPTFTQPYGPANKTPVQDIPSFDVGGFIGRDMLAMVHAGEWVIPNAGKIALPPEVMARIQMPNIPGAPNVPNVPFSTGSSGGTGDSFTFIIQGITDPDLLAREISSRIKTRTGRTARFSN